MAKAKVVKPKAVKSKPTKFSLSQKTVAWIIGGIVIIITLIAIAVGVATTSRTEDSEDANQTTLTVENGKGETLQTTYYQVESQNFSIKVPTSFKTLTAAEIDKRYSGEVPNVVFANSDNNVNIAISTSNVAVSNDQIQEYLDVMRELLAGSSNIIDSSIYIVDNHNIATVKVATEGDAGNFYNHMIFFSNRDKLMIIAFNCELSERNIWEKVGDFVLNSLKFEE